jgi:hypothetical protein
MAAAKLKLLRNKCRAESISLPEDIQRVSRILVCLPPNQRVLTIIKQLLPEVTRIFSEAEIYLMASPGHNVYDIFPRKGFRIMSPSSNHIAWTGLASKRYLEVLAEKKYDLILDLNLEPNYFVQSILLSFPKAIRIGTGDSLGTPFYNLEIKTRFIRDESRIYKSMLATIDNLKNPGRNRVNGTVT